jgi:hypothetical protein
MEVRPGARRRVKQAPREQERRGSLEDTLPSVRTTHGTTNSDERRKRSRRSLGG